ncbi:MAG: 50S ribosomal protein L20 [Chlamydiota bacterium]
MRGKCAVASRRRRKRILKRAKGFWGDRKNHIRQTRDAVMKAMAFSTEHRKRKKADFRRLWIVRLSVAAKLHGLSYSRLICGLQRAGAKINRKILSEMAIKDPAGFAAVAETAKRGLL